MEFAQVLQQVVGHLKRRGHRYALIGGHGLAAYGLSRSTLDLDLVVDAAAQGRLIEFLEEQGYETLHRSSGYSNHLHPETDKGRVDFVYVRGDTAGRLFEDATVLPGPAGVEIPVPSPEHLAAMKILAMKNDPGRRLQELADLRFLAGLPGTDHDAIKKHFERHGLAAEFEELNEEG